MRSHAKASPDGSPLHPKGPTKLLVAFATILTLALCAMPAISAADSLPTISNEEASEIGVTTAKLSGKVDPNGTAGAGNTTWRFQFSPIGEENWSTVGEGSIEPPASEEANPIPVEAVFGYGGELQPGQEYEFRLAAENGAGQVETPPAYPTFTMDEAVAPVLTISAPTNIGAHSAHLAGTLDPEGGNTNPIGPEIMPIRWQLQYSADGAEWHDAQPVGNSELSGAEAQGNSPIVVEADASSLIAGETYQVRLHVSSSNYSNFSLVVDSPGPNPSFETGVTVPTITERDIGAFDPTATSATMYGFVNPEATEISDCHFVYGIGAASGHEAPCSPSHVATNEQQDFSVFHTAIEESEPFTLTFESETTGQLPADVDPGTVQTALEALPSIGAGNVSVARLRGSELYPNSFRVTFVGALSGQDLPQIEGPSGGTHKNGGLDEPVEVHARPTDLQADSEYRYKVVATNAVGTSEGPVQSFRTLEPAAATTCPNEALRAERHVTAAECRAYELVSPTDKNNTDVTGDGTQIVASADGNGVVFVAKGGFAESMGSGILGESQYLSRRGATGWSTKGITPTPSPNAEQVAYSQGFVDVFSDDLRHGLAFGYDFPGVEGGIPDEDGLSQLDTETGAMETMMPFSQALAPGLPAQYKVIGVYNGTSADAGVVSFNSTTKFAPNAEGFLNAYEWNHGTLRLAGILPDGSVPSGGSTVPRQGTLDGYRATVSSDGSRVLFTAAPPEGSDQLYVRRNHSNTVWISEPERSAPVPVSELVSPALSWVSPDGKKILFRTNSSLVDGDTNSTGDLYLYTDGPDPAAEQNLTLITGLEGAAIVGASDDAKRIYFRSSADGSLNLWEDGVIHHIVGGHNEGGILPWDAPGTTRVSQDGRILSFLHDQLEVVGPTGAEVLATQMYVFDAVTNTLSCASCMADRATTPGVPAEPRIHPAGAERSLFQLRPRFLSDDGSRVFFSTQAPLVAGDTNGAMDVYVYDTRTGKRGLVSTGKSEGGEWFANASSTGGDAFLLTPDQLIGADQDTLLDLYDARVDGGIAEPPPPPTPCAGDGCRGALSGALGGVSPATASFSGPGNPHRKAHHHRKHRRKKHAQRKHRHLRQGNGGGR